MLSFRFWAYLIAIIIGGSYSGYNVYHAKDNLYQLAKQKEISISQVGSISYFGIQKCPIEVFFTGTIVTGHKISGTYCGGFMTLSDELDIHTIQAP